MTSLEGLKKISPQQCRLLARTGPNNRQRPMTNDEIIARAARDGFSLSRASAAKFSRLDDWDSMTLKKVKAWIVGTGIDPMNKKTLRQLRNLISKRSKLVYQKNATTSQKLMIDRILLSESSRSSGQVHPPNGLASLNHKAVGGLDSAKLAWQCR
jgi:hypothetical protein